MPSSTGFAEPTETASRPEVAVRPDPGRDSGPEPPRRTAGRRVVRGSAWYLLAGCLNKAIGFLLLPIYTTHLTAAEYGGVATVVVIGSFLHLLSGGALTAAVTRYYHGFGHDHVARSEFLGTVLGAVFASSSVVCVALLIGGEWALRPALGDVPYWPLMAMAIGVALFQPFFDTCLSILQTAERPGAYVALALGNVLTKTLLAIWLVVGLEWSASGVLAAHLLTAAVFFGCALVGMRGLAKLCWRPEPLRRSLRYSLPLLLHTMSSHGRTMVDRILIVQLLGAAATGVYHIGFLLATVTQLATMAGNKALNPVIMRALHDDDHAALGNVRNLGLTAVLFYCWIAVGVSWLSIDVLHWLSGPEFHSAHRVVAWLALTCVLHGVFGLVMTEVYFDEQRSKRVGLTTFGCLLVGVGLGVWLIPRFGMVGAAWAALISQSLLLGWAVWTSRGIGRIEWPLARLATMLLATGLLATLVPTDLGIPAKLLAAAGGFGLLNQIAYGSPVHLVREMARVRSARAT